jgi:hypothetical protein
MLPNFEVRTTGIIGAALFPWMSAKNLWRIDEGQVIIPADRIRTHTQTEHIYDNYYIQKREQIVLYLSKSGLFSFLYLRI